VQCISGIVNDKVFINNFRFPIIKQFPLILDRRSQSYLSWFIVSLPTTTSSILFNSENSNTNIVQRRWTRWQRVVVDQGRKWSCVMGGLVRRRTRIPGAQTMRLYGRTCATTVLTSYPTFYTAVNRLRAPHFRTIPSKCCCLYPDSWVCYCHQFHELSLFVCCCYNL